MRAAREIPCSIWRLYNAQEHDAHSSIAYLREKATPFLRQCEAIAALHPELLCFILGVECKLKFMLCYHRQPDAPGTRHCTCHTPGGVAPPGQGQGGGCVRMSGKRLETQVQILLPPLYLAG